MEGSQVRESSGAGILQDALWKAARYVRVVGLVYCKAAWYVRVMGLVY